MLDRFLLWLVVVIPVGLGILLIWVPTKDEDWKGHMRWRKVLEGV